MSLVDFSAAVVLGCKQRWNNVNKMVWSYCYHCTTTHFNNVFLQRYHQSHCVRPTSDQAIANSNPGSKRLATPGLVSVTFNARKLYLACPRRFPEFSKPFITRKVIAFGFLSATSKFQVWIILRNISQAVYKESKLLTWNPGESLPNFWKKIGVAIRRVAQSLA